jgi:HEAT repeat protein
LELSEIGVLRDRRDIAGLIAALKAEDVRWAAALALKTIGEPAVGPLIAALKDGSKDVRRVAAYALREIGDGRASEPLLIATLKDESKDVRRAADDALWRIGEPAVGPLIAALKDKDRFMRQAATDALWKIGEPAVGPLIAALKDEDVRQAAVTALRKIGYRRSVEPLIAALKDESIDVRLQAAEALGAIGDMRAVDPLIAALKDESKDVRRIAAEALGKLSRGGRSARHQSATPGRGAAISRHAGYRMNYPGTEEKMTDTMGHSAGFLQLGSVLSNTYRILSVVGKGRSSVVFQADDLGFPNGTLLCAVKEMVYAEQDQDAREESLKNFDREAETMMGLTHPAFPQIYDFFNFSDRAYLVREFIQGRDLLTIVNSTTNFLPVEQVQEWGIEICDALSYLHTYQPEPIIFRDMKPSHIMINQRNRVRLIDFGITNIFRAGQQGMMIGTEGYSAPEAFTGKYKIAHDIYALGATLHHLLTRRDPRFEPPFSFAQAPISAYNPNVPDALAAVVMRALSFDREERYQSAEGMKQALIAVGGSGSAGL